jgi:hypothetical protein
MPTTETATTETPSGPKEGAVALTVEDRLS